MSLDNNLQITAPAEFSAESSVFERIAMESLLELLRNVRLAEGFQKKIDLFAEGIAACGWRRIHLYLVDSKKGELVSASSWGLDERQREHLKANGLKISELRSLFQPQFEKYRVGRCFYFPHDCLDPMIIDIRSDSVKSLRDSSEFKDWHPSDILYFPLIGFGGKIIGLMSMDDPVSGRRPTEEDLRIVELFVDSAVGLIEEGEFEHYFDKTHSLMSRLFDLSPIMIFLVDENERIIDLNNAAVEKIGYSREEIVGSAECRIIASSEVFKEIIAKRKLGSFSGEVLISGKKSDMWGLFFSVPVYSNNGRIDGYITHIIDITESKKLQQYLVRAEKLAGIGVLASGIAHEINNPLYAILGTAENIMASGELPANLKDELNEIVGYTKEASQILKEFSGYTYSAQRESEFPVNLNEVARNAVKLVSRSTDVAGVIFKLAFGEISEIRASASEIMQVFVNLITNSLDALPRENGQIKISTFEEEDDVFCVVEDNGHGIPESMLGDVFEPFYTTKEVGKGTGLGLYVCYKIVTKYHGIIEIKSREGKGTAVFLKFPKSK